MADIHIIVAEPDNVELEMMRDKMLAYIFPNSPITEKQQEVFEKAVRYQIAHEKTIIAQCGDNALPQGTKSFNIGDFSMTFGDDALKDALTKKTICPYAYGILLREGLLYKGVERSY